jgi:chromosome segregation ATPase
LEREKRLEAERGTLQAQLKAAEQAAAEAQAEREFLRDRLKAAEISVNRQQEIALRAQQQADALRGELSEVRGQLADATTPKALPEAAPAPRRPWWKVWG